VHGKEGGHEWVMRGTYGREGGTNKSPGGGGVVHGRGGGRAWVQRGCARQGGGTHG
jgi:hypothetical protein